VDRALCGVETALVTGRAVLGWVDVAVVPIETGELETPAVFDGGTTGVLRKVPKALMNPVGALEALPEGLSLPPGGRDMLGGCGYSCQGGKKIETFERNQ
jgi:hypothetical protein